MLWSKMVKFVSDGADAGGGDGPDDEPSWHEFLRQRENGLSFGVIGAYSAALPPVIFLILLSSTKVFSHFHFVLWGLQHKFGQGGGGCLLEQKNNFLQFPSLFLSD
jgi:hypothetical protein